MIDNLPSNSSEKNQILLSEEQYHRITQELELLRNKIKSQLVLFGDLNGQLISQKGELLGVDMSILTALISSDFSATSEIAKILSKDNRFTLHFHEGSKRNLYISGVGTQFFLAVIFDTTVTLGMVRIFTQKTIEKIGHIIETSFDEVNRLNTIIDSEFKSFVVEGLDKILE